MQQYICYRQLAGLTKTVNDYVRTCDVCQKNKIGGRRNHGLIPLPTALTGLLLLAYIYAINL